MIVNVIDIYQIHAPSSILFSKSKVFLLVNLTRNSMPVFITPLGVACT